MKNYPPRACTLCGNTYVPTGPAQQFCRECGVPRAKAIARAHTDRHRAASGVRVGIGSGNAQGRGPANHSWKTGVSRFKAFSRTARQTIRFCQRCQKDLLNAPTGHWAVHHVDHDQTHNDPSNWELLCKRCHQLEHRCWLNYGRGKKAA